MTKFKYFVARDDCCDGRWHDWQREQDATLVGWKANKDKDDDDPGDETMVPLILLRNEYDDLCRDAAPASTAAAARPED